LEVVPVPDVPLGGGGHDDDELPELLEVDPVVAVPEVEPELPFIGGGHEVDPVPVDEPVDDPMDDIEEEPVELDPDGGEEPADGEPAVKLMVWAVPDSHLWKYG